MFPRLASSSSINKPYSLPSSPTNLVEECCSDFMDLLMDCSSDFNRSNQTHNRSKCSSTNSVHASVGSPDRSMYRVVQPCPSEYAPDEWILDLFPEPSHPAWHFTSTNGMSNQPLNLQKPIQPETTPSVPRAQIEPRQSVPRHHPAVFDLKFIEKYLREASIDMAAMNNQMERLEEKFARLKDDIHQMMEPFTYPETGVTRLTLVNKLKDIICDIRQRWVNVKQDFEGNVDVISRLDVMLGDLETSDALAESAALTVLRKNLTDLDTQSAELFTKLGSLRDNLDQLDNIVKIEELVVKLMG